MTLNRPKSPDPTDDPRNRGDLDAQFFESILGDLEEFEHGADLWALISAIGGILGRYPSKIINAEQRARLIAALDRAGEAAVRHLELFDPDVVDNGFAALRFAADAWARPPLPREAHDLAGPTEARRCADAAAHSKIFLNEVSTEALRRRIVERAGRAKAPRPAAAPQPDHSYKPAVVQIAERFERVARGGNTIADAADGLRRIVELLGYIDEGFLDIEPPGSAALSRLENALSAAVFPLAKAAGAAVSSDHIALGLGCAAALLVREFAPAAISLEWTPERLTCMRSHVRLLTAEVEALQQRRAIDAAGNVVFRGALAAHLWRRAEPVANVLH